MRLSEITLKDGLEDVALWGVQPMKHLVEILDDELDLDAEEWRKPENERVVFIVFELKDKLRDLEDTLMRLDNELHGRGPLSLVAGNSSGG